jgi:ketosteroid isomerase-like protein
MSYLQKVQDLYAMINSGQLLEAFEKFYADDVVMQEIGEAERVGKDVNREYEKKFLSMIQEVHGGGVIHFTSNEETGVTMAENWMDVTFQDGNRINMAQVAVQTWKGDQVIKEVFYHK